MTPELLEVVRLIIRTKISSGNAECLRIVAGIAQSPFNPVRRSLDEWGRSIGLEPFLGKPHPNGTSEQLHAASMLTSLDWHALKHTDDGGWPTGTTSASYLQSVRKDIAGAKELVVGKDADSVRQIAQTITENTSSNAVSTVSFFSVDKNHIISAYRTALRKAKAKTRTWAITVTMKAA